MTEDRYKKKIRDFGFMYSMPPEKFREAVNFQIQSERAQELMKLILTKGEVADLQHSIKMLEDIRDRVGGGDVETALGQATSAMRRALRKYYEAAGFKTVTINKLGEVTKLGGIE